MSERHKLREIAKLVAEWRLMAHMNRAKAARGESQVPRNPNGKRLTPTELLFEAECLDGCANDVTALVGPSNNRISDTEK